jgi:hypothetical protein
VRSTDVSDAAWRKSSRSVGSTADQTNCVEVAELRDRVAMRDSKDSAGPVLAFTRTQWRTFLNNVQTSHFD